MKCCIKTSLVNCCRVGSLVKQRGSASPHIEIILKEKILVSHKPSIFFFFVALATILPVSDYNIFTTLNAEVYERFNIFNGVRQGGPSLQETRAAKR